MGRFHLCPRGQRYSIIHLRCIFTRSRYLYLTDIALRPHFGHLYSSMLQFLRLGEETERRGALPLMRCRWPIRFLLTS
jgi:hypothetical protein